MTTLVPRALVVLALLLLGTSATCAQNALDRAVSAEYLEIEKGLQSMDGDLKDAERRDLMSAFQARCRSFVEKYQGDSSRMTTGLFDVARAHLHLANPAAAKPLLEGFIKTLPEHDDVVEATLLLGDVHRAVNELEAAAATYRTFLTRYSKDDSVPYARIGLATSLMLAFDLPAAIAEFKALITAHPDHQVSADAAFQLAEAYIDAGQFDDARKHLDGLIAEHADATELVHRREVLDLLGNTAPDLKDIQGWVGAVDSNVGRVRGNVLVLCFFMNWSLPCTQELQFLSELSTELGNQGLVVWGITKNYKAKAAWPPEKEAKWLARYRENPRFILEKELPANTNRTEKQQEVWASLDKPITASFAVTKTFDNHRTYTVRGVPCIVVIDRLGVVRMVKEGGSPPNGYQRKLLRKTVRSLLSK